MITKMNLKKIALAALLASAFPAQAGFMLGGPGEGAAAAFDTVLTFTDEATGTELQTQRDAVTDLRSQLETLASADERDSDAITEVKNQLREARHSLRSDVRDVVDANSELKTALNEQREAARSERAINRYALHNEDAFGELVGAATEEQVASLETNKAAMEALKTQAFDARAAGASREEMREIRDQMRTQAQEQAEVVGEILDANQELQTEFASASEELLGEMRPPRRGRGRGH